MALRLHIDKKYWRCVYNILRCVYKEITMRLWEKIWRCVYITGRKKCNLPPLIILIVVGELFRLSLDVMEPFLALIPFLLSKGKHGGCADV